MSYITEIFERANLQQIREFLFHGVECIEVSDETYKQRLKVAADTILKTLKEKFPNEEEREKVMNDVHYYAGVSEDVYMEIGLQCGAILVTQLLENPKE